MFIVVWFPLSILSFLFFGNKRKGYHSYQGYNNRRWDLFIMFWHKNHQAQHELPPASAGGTYVYQQNLIKFSKRDKFILVLGLLKQRHCSVEWSLA